MIYPRHGIGLGVHGAFFDFLSFSDAGHHGLLFRGERSLRTSPITLYPRSGIANGCAVSFRLA